MENWRTLRKTKCLVFLTCAHAISALIGTDFQLRKSPEFELKFDLNSNLHKRSKESSIYLDARELADGDINRLELVQMGEKQVINGLVQAQKSMKERPNTWKLTILLEGEHSFRVKHKPISSDDYTSLVLKVV